MIAIVMGVSGAGKSTVAKAMVAATGWNFAEGDDYHSAANRQKMQSGTPLTDADRAPWLDALHEVLSGWAARGENGVMTCSALKEKYRETLAAGLPAGSYRFVLLEAPKDELKKRLEARAGHFMNPDLLDSQIATLEVPKDALRIENIGSPEELAQKILDQLK